MILQRLKQYIDEKGISVAAFERSVGMSNASFRRSLNNDRAIGTDKLEKILKLYSDINPDWLITGKGSMYRETASGIPTSDIEDVNNNPILKESEEIYSIQATISNEKYKTLVSENKLLKTEIRFLNEKIKLLEDTIHDKERIIGFLSES